MTHAGTARGPIDHAAHSGASSRKVGVTVTPAVTYSCPRTMTSACSGRPVTQMPSGVSRTSVTAAKSTVFSASIRRTPRVPSSFSVSADCGSRCASTPAEAMAISAVWPSRMLRSGVGHLDFHLKGARRRIGGARDKGDGACDLAVARGQPRLRLRAKADAVNLGLGDKAHQFDRIKLDHLRTKRSGLQQAAKLCGVAFQQPFERRGEGQPVNLGLGAGDGGLRSLNAGMCRIQPRLGRAECGARGGDSCFGGGQPWSATKTRLRPVFVPRSA